MSKQIKLEARERIASILSAAVALSETVGYNRITRDEIAEALSIPPSLISYHLGAMADLRRQIMREALRVENLPVIAQGLCLRDRHALKATDELKARALSSMGKA